MRKFHLYILICMFLSLIAAPSAFAQCPCSVWNPSATPGLADSGDGTPGEYGVKIRSDVDGFITGVRFYKSAANTGSHVGNLWSVTGNLLATANFVGETPSGWQQVNFSSPVAITANTTYIVSYYAPAGHYSFDANYFGSVSTDNGPLHALANGTDGPNAVYNYGPVTTFPTSSFSSSNYWVDVVFNTTNAPNVSAFSPTGSGVAVSSAVSATFTVALDSNTVNSSTFQLLDPNSVPVAASVTYNGGTQVATLQPSSALSSSTTYTAVVTGGPGGVVGLNGTPMAANYAWSFTTASPPPPRPHRG